MEARSEAKEERGARPREPTGDLGRDPSDDGAERRARMEVRDDVMVQNEISI